MACTVDAKSWTSKSKPIKTPISTSQPVQTMTNQQGPGCIAVDAMGGDMGPEEVVHALRMAFDEVESIGRIMLVGDQAVLKPLLEQNGLANEGRLTIHHASEVIDMEDKPVHALKTKRDSSMVKALELVKTGTAQGMLSCGNTGALMSGGTLIVRRMAGIRRPALCSVIPNRHRHFILIDAGANPDATAEDLVQNAILGSNYARVALYQAQPRVGLLTIGTEEGKGSEKIHETHRMLKAVNGIINYTGPVEGFQLFGNKVDVVVCDGFTGNILIKGLESCYKMLSGFLKEELLKTPTRKAGAFLSRGAYQTLKKKLSPEKFGGAPLLGLKGLVMKAHGSSNRVAIMCALRLAIETLQKDMVKQTLSDIEKANTIIRSSRDEPAPASPVEENLPS